MAKPQRARLKAHCLPLAAPVMLAMLMAPPARAEWKVVPSIDLRETYTDNVRLEADANARASFVSELAPALAISEEGPRLKLHASALSHLYGYSGERIDGTNRSQSQLIADAHAKLVEDLLFLDGAASTGQQPVSAFGPQASTSNGYSTANRTKVSTWRLSPYLAHRFGHSANGELRYTRDSVKTGNIGLGDSTSSTLSASLASGSSFRAIGWNLQANRQDLSDTLDRKYHTETTNATLHFRVVPTLTLDTSGGYDKYDYQAPAGESAGKSYSVGFTWTPSLRTSIQASAGKRYFGPSYLLAATHRSRRSVWSINYNDAVTTTRDQLLIPAAVNAVDVLDRLFSTSITDPEARRQAVDAYIRANGLPPSLAHNINYFSNRFILQRQFQATVAFNTAKTTTVVALNASRRRGLSAAETDTALVGSAATALNDNTRQAGASVLVSYRLSPRTGLNLAFSDARTESLSTAITDNRKSLSLSMTSQLQRNLKGAVELRHNAGRTAFGTIGTYHENALSASLSYQL